jgi:hypothetical protein
MLTADFDLSGLTSRAEKSRSIIGAGLRRAVQEGLVEGADYARTHHTHRRRTGELTGARLYGRFLRADDRRADGELVNETPYAFFVEYGTKPHRIWPKEGHGFVGPLQAGQSRRARTDIGTHRIALRWYVGNRPVFARYVDHPGTLPMPFMEPASWVAGKTIVFELEHWTILQLANLWN